MYIFWIQIYFLCTDITKPVDVPKPHRKGINNIIAIYFVKEVVISVDKATILLPTKFNKILSINFDNDIIGKNVSL